METSKILSADFLDIIFDGRYKEYGAYELRKTYNKRITYALAGTFVICLALLIGSVLASSAKKIQSQMLVHDVLLEDLKPPVEKKPDVQPPPSPRQDPPKVELAKVTPPKIVRDNEVKPEDEVKEVNTLDEVKISNINREGVKDDNIVAPIVESKGTGVVKAPAQEDDKDVIFTIVQIPAQFPGGLKEWERYLRSHLNSSLPAENGAPPNRYTVVVSFIVDRSGKISDVQAENDPGYGTKEEAIRVIKKGPDWVPAIQNGRNVIYRHKQGISFDVLAE